MGDKKVHCTPKNLLNPKCTPLSFSLCWNIVNQVIKEVGFDSLQLHFLGFKQLKPNTKGLYISNLANM